MPSPAPSPAPLRWGILGAAEIARKNWKAIRNSGNGIVTAVASRERSRAEAYIAQCQSTTPFAATPRAFGSYEELLASPEVDAVYLPLPTGLRKEWVVRAAQAGKHVLCEKPCAASAADLREMLAACERNHVQFMDGVMFVHSRRLDAIREVLDDGRTVGPLRRITSAFSFCAPPEFFRDNIRSHSGLEPQGCLGDLGWYCLRFALWAMQGRMPRAVRGLLLAESSRVDHAGSVPTEFSGELFFDGGVTAAFYCSFLTELQQWAHLSGPKGSLRVPDFVIPDFGCEARFETSQPHYRVEGCDFQMEPNLRSHSVPEYSNSHSTAHEANLFRHFGEAVRSNSLNRAWPEIALQTQRLVDACLASARTDGRPITDF